MSGATFKWGLQVKNTLLVSVADSSVIKHPSREVAAKKLGMDNATIEWSLQLFGEAYNNGHIIVDSKRRARYVKGSNRNETYH